MPVSLPRFSCRCRSALIVLAVLSVAAPASAQDVALPFTAISLEDLSAFSEAGENWTVAGRVAVDRRVDGDLRPHEGTGVLVNRPSKEHNANLFTEMEHGNIELELDFLVPKGSNSGIYLMGRYEVQVFDSWGADPPLFSDAGGIYQRWDETRGAGREGFEGHPPRVNASRAPGLWQHLRILFEAPRFDAQGRKTADARFARVEHNGVVVHENVEVTGPTRAAAFDDERPLGPLMLQGDHGPVAYRNIRFKRYDAAPARLADLRYRAFVEPALDVTGSTVHSEGDARAVAPYVSGDRDEFAMEYEGHFHAPTAGMYLFDIGLGWVDSDPHFEDALTGSALIYLGDEEVVRHEGRAPHATGTVELEPGVHPFRLVFFKDRPWNDPRMTLHVEGPGFPRIPLHDPGSLPAAEGVGAITVSAERAPVIQRVFMPHGNDKRTHAAAVGDPLGVHYAVDLAGGALLYAWRGPFIETTPMWHDRGSDQIALPLGSFITLDGAAALASLPSTDTPWPRSASSASAVPGSEASGSAGPEAAATYEIAFAGYTLDAEGRPTFLYRLGDARVEDAVRPAEDGRGLHRRLRITGGGGLTARLAEAAQITPAEGGGYLVDGAFYVEPETGLAPTIRRINGRDELVVRIPEGATADIGYTLIW